jgi:hypothetical protein
LPGSTLSDELRQLGYDVTEIGEGERIIPGAITEVVVTEHSTVPITVTYAGTCKVKRCTGYWNVLGCLQRVAGTRRTS